MCTPSTFSAICIITGSIVVVKGILSTNALATAETHCTRTIATCERCAIGTISIKDDRADAISLNKPNSAIPSVNTNNPAKNNKLSHSTFSKACSKLFCFVNEEEIKIC